MRFDFIALGMGLAFALIWSSAFTSARIIVADASPLTSLAVRFLISGLVWWPQASSAFTRDIISAFASGT